MTRLSTYEFSLNLKSRQSMGDHVGYRELAVADTPQNALALVQQNYGSDLLAIMSGPTRSAHDALAGPLVNTTPASGPYLIGGFGTQQVTSAGNTTIAPNGANEITAYLFYQPAPVQVNVATISLAAKSTTAGILANFGLYDINKNLLVDSGPFPVGLNDVNGVLTRAVVSPVLLQADWYYFAFGCGDNLASFGYISVLGSGAIQGILTKNVTRGGRAANAIAAGALPAALGAITVGTGSGSVPACAFET
jgi:hypothetical protein